MFYVKTLIIGGGFSAYISKAIFPSAKVLAYSGKTPRPFSQKSFEINKPLSQWAPSNTKLTRPKKEKIMLHSRDILGGNSRIWGGFINTKHLQNDAHLLLKKAGINLVPLSVNLTGSVSNSEALFQMRDGRDIFDVSKKLSPDLFGEAEYFTVSEGRKIVNYTDEQGKQKWMACDNLIIACGVIKTLEFLLNSGLVDESNSLRLSEYEYFLSCKKPERLIEGSLGIGYTIDRAFRHFLGATNSASYANPKTVVIWQIFNQKKHYLDFTIKSKVITPSRKIKKFGASIHYCNLEIDGAGVNTVLAKVGNGIHVVGMAGTRQAEPGPISNDIVQHALSLKECIIL